MDQRDGNTELAGHTGYLWSSFYDFKNKTRQGNQTGVETRPVSFSKYQTGLQVLSSFPLGAEFQLR